MATRRTNKIPFTEKLGYGVGALSYGVPFQMISGLFTYYANAVLGIPGAITGGILALSIVWDAVTDPVMGYISDKTSDRILFGRRLFYVLIGAVGIAVTNYFFWSIDPGLSQIEKAAWLGILLILVKTFSTVLTTPYLALGSELSSDYIERASVQSFRTSFFFLGFMFPTIIGFGFFFRPTDGYPIGQNNPAAYPRLGITSSLIVLVCAAICIWLTYKKTSAPKMIKTKKRSSVTSMFKETGIALRDSDFRNVSLTLLFVNLAMGIVGAVGLHMFTYTFGFDNKQIVVIFGALFLMALVAQPIWVIIANRLDKREAMKLCLIINLVVSGVFMFYVLINHWVSENYLIVLPLAMAMGFSMGGSVAMPYSMISDTIDKNEFETGTRNEGVFYGCATFMFKLSQALAAMFVGFMIDIIGFVADKENPPPPDVTLKLGMILPVGFLICFSLALYFLFNYKLNRQKVVEYQQQITARAASNSQASSQESLPDCPGH